MNTLTRITFGLFIVCLPGCYFTPVPAILGALIFLALYGEQCFIRFMGLHSASQLETHFDKMQAELDEMRMHVNGLSMRAGMGGLTIKKTEK